MATVDDVLAAINHVKECTGDPKAWLTGLTPQDATDVITIFGATPQRLDGLLAKIRQQHPDLFDPTTGAMIFPPRRGGPPPTPGAPPVAPGADRQEGDAANAIRDAETALAQQNSATAQLDLQVIAAILNAHQQNAEGKEALDKLQHDIEAAVETRSDLDTPAGARDFQRFLIGKLRDIRAVIANASLTGTSEAALWAAWTSLYNASKGGQDDPSERRPPAVTAPSPSGSTELPIKPDAGMDPDLDSLLAGDPGFLPRDAPAQSPPTAAPAAPSIPSLGGGGMPGGGAMPGFGVPGGLPLAGPLRGSGKKRLPTGLDEAPLGADDVKDRPSPDDADDTKSDDEATESPAAPESPPAGPTTVTLPNGETVTAGSPQLAAAIKAAAEGTSIADAFRQQGITIPPPGTAVASPVDAAQVAPGDIGMFTDRHALALGNSKALLNGQIQHISTVTGPSFLGWEHPPAPATATAPTKTGTPTPTRPASIAGT